MLEIVKSEFASAGVREVAAVGKFLLSDCKPKLFPGSVYGFFVNLSRKEAKEFFDEARQRQALYTDDFSDFQPIKDDYYPIYWGKDKALGKRPHEHLKDPKGTGSIRLSTYRSLRGKEIHSIVVIVDDNEKLENHLQKMYPHLLLTKTAQHNS